MLYNERLRTPTGGTLVVSELYQGVGRLRRPFELKAAPPGGKVRRRFPVQFTQVVLCMAYRAGPQKGLWVRDILVRQQRRPLSYQPTQNALLNAVLGIIAVEAPPPGISQRRGPEPGKAAVDSAESADFASASGFARSDEVAICRKCREATGPVQDVPSATW